MPEEMDVFHGSVRLPAAFVAAGRRRIDGNPAFPMAPGHHLIHRPELSLDEDDIPRFRLPGQPRHHRLEPFPGKGALRRHLGPPGLEISGKGKERPDFPLFPSFLFLLFRQNMGKQQGHPLQGSPRSDPCIFVMRLPSISGPVLKPV